MVDVVGFSWGGLGERLSAVSDDAVSDAFVVAFNTPFGKKLFSFGGLEDFLGAVYPAASEAKGMGGVHEIAHYQRAVVEVCGILFVGQDYQDYGSAVEGVGVAAHNVGVEFRQAVANFFVCYGDYYGRLFSHSGRGICTRFKDLVDEFLFGHLVLICSDCPSCFKDFQCVVFTHIVVGFG